MAKELKSNVINLKIEAKQASVQMLKEIKLSGTSLKIDHSRLISFIVVDYFDIYFKKSKNKIIDAHRDSKKQIQGKLSKLNEKQLHALSRYISKIEIKDELETDDN
jgi:hypothetical protein